MGGRRPLYPNMLFWAADINTDPLSLRQPRYVVRDENASGANTIP